MNMIRPKLEQFSARLPLCIALLLVLGIAALPCRNCHAAESAAPPVVAAVATETEETFSVMLLDGRRVGFNRYLREVGEDGRVTMSSWTNMKLGRGSFVIESRSRTQEIAAADGRLISLIRIDDTAGASKRITGRLEGSTLHLEETVADRKRQWTLEWTDGAVTREGERLLIEKQPQQSGHKYAYTVFEYAELTFFNVETTIMEPREISLLDGSKAQASHSSSRLQRDGMVLIAEEFSDRDGHWLRRDMSIMGMKFSEFSCDRKTALADFEAHEIFSGTLLKSTSPIPDDAAAVIIKLGLKKVDGSDAVLPPSSGPQTVRDNGDGTVTLRYQLMHPKPGQKLPYSGDDDDVRRFLQPTPTVQSDDEKIIEAAREAVGKRTDAAEAAERIARWINQKMRADWTVGYATASEVIRDMRGDCTEYSVLTAAMCRAAGIPARLASGYMYVENWDGHRRVFGGHAWVQVHVNGQWHDLDASIEAPYRTAGRILVSTSAGDEPTNINDLTLRGAMTIISAEVEGSGGE